MEESRCWRWEELQKREIRDRLSGWFVCSWQGRSEPEGGALAAERRQRGWDLEINVPNLELLGSARPYLSHAKIECVFMIECIFMRGNILAHANECGCTELLFCYFSAALPGPGLSGVMEKNGEV